jgi:hypothetical protein
MPQYISFYTYFTKCSLNQRRFLTVADCSKYFYMMSNFMKWHSIKQRQQEQK